MGTTDRFAPGWRIGDYIIDGDLGDGYMATHVLLPRRVRLDVMHPTNAGLRQVAVRMMREACILEVLRHPGVPRVFEVGVIAEDRSNRPWLASELVDGAPAWDDKPRPAAEVLALVRDVADVLAHAHERGIVHRRLRLDAIVRRVRSCVFPLCVIDWCDARADGSEEAAAADIHALGILAVHALTGQPPRPPLRTTRELVPDAPARLCLMIDDLLVANPMARPSAAEVRARAKLIVETLHEDDDTIVEETVVLVDISRAPPPIPNLHTRWTPALGAPCAPKPPANGIAIGVLKPRR